MLHMFPKYLFAENNSVHISRNKLYTRFSLHQYDFEIHVCSALLIFFQRIAEFSQRTFGEAKYSMDAKSLLLWAKKFHIWASTSKTVQ